MKTMLRGRFYKHPECIDTCVMVVRSFDIPEKDLVEVKLQWWRLYKNGKKVPFMNDVGYIETKHKKTREYWLEWQLMEG